MAIFITCLVVLAVAGCTVIAAVFAQDSTMIGHLPTDAEVGGPVVRPQSDHI